MRHGETHSFNVEVACVVGTNAAVIFNHIAFWCRTNRAKGIEEMHVDGHWWTTFSVRDAAELYPYLTERQVSYAIRKLVDTGLVMEDNHNGSKWDHRKWYRVADDDEPAAEPERKRKDDDRHSEEVAEVIEHLNEVAGTNYRTNAGSHAKFIRGRLSDGYDVGQLIAVIDAKADEWLGTEWEKYLQPSTLFRASNFDNYAGKLGKREREVSKYADYA